MNPDISVIDMLAIALGLTCVIILLAEAINPFIDRTCDELRGLAAVSNVNDEDLYPEVDHTIMEAFLKEPTEQERQDIQAHIDRRARRENAEEAMLLERFKL